MLCAVAGGVMLWELTRLLRPGCASWIPLAKGAAAFTGLAVVLLADGGIASIWMIIGAGLLLVALLLPAAQLRMIMFGGAVLFASFTLGQLREQAGFTVVAWLMVVVFATDIAAYFSGKSLGGPRLAPALSPGKRWSGAVGGCIAAVLVSAAFHGPTAAAAIATGLALSIASQSGDLAESWLKRKAGVKDSSNLIPGHGGLLDRFDGMTGASVFAGLLELLGLHWQAGLI